MKNIENLVSIIIPCYNCSNYINETLISVFNQTYKNIEIICVNDGSTDNTLEILNLYKEENKNLKIINKKNEGVSVARNYGIDSSLGEYICFCDSDDLLHPEFISKLVEGTKNNDTAYCLLTRNYKMFSRNNSYGTEQKTQQKTMYDFLYNMGEISFFNFIYKKKILVDNKIKFIKDTKYGEDREFAWKYLCHCSNALFINSTLYFYRKNQTSATKGKMTWRRTDSLKAVERTKNYLKQNNCDFYNEYSSYMPARVMWAVAKAFSVSKQKDLFNRLLKEYDVKKYMKRTSKDKNKKVALASHMFLICPYLFYLSIGLVG